MVPISARGPECTRLQKTLMLSLASVITDPVTTTDELIPSGETSSLRSNPLKLAEYALSRKDPGYVEGRRQLRLSRTCAGRRLKEEAERYPLNLSQSSHLQDRECRETCRHREHYLCCKARRQVSPSRRHPPRRCWEERRI